MKRMRNLQSDINMLIELQSELDKIYQNLALAAFICSRWKWIEHGTRNTKCFPNLDFFLSVNSIDTLKINEQISEDTKTISDFIEVYIYIYIYIYFIFFLFSTTCFTSFSVL